MELKIINKEPEPLLSRTKVEVEIEFDKATPSNEDVKAQLVKDLGKDEKLIVVKNIYTNFGLKKAKSMSYVYDDEESLKRIEPQPKKKAEKKEEKAEGKAKEQKPAETPGKKEDAGKSEILGSKTPGTTDVVSRTNSVGKPDKAETKKDEKPQETKAEEKQSKKQKTEEKKQ